MHITSRSTVSVAVMALVGLPSCSAGSSSGSRQNRSPAGRATLTPQQDPPSSPGVLVAGPPGIALSEGGKAQLWVKAYRSDGSHEAAPTVTWEAMTPEVGSVDATGLITGVQPGLARFRATDQGRRTATIDVPISQCPQPGSCTFGSLAVGLEFDPPVLQLTVGETKTVAVQAFDANGNAVAMPAGVELAAWSPSGVTVGAGFAITATAPGATPVRAHDATGGYPAYSNELGTDGQPLATMAPLSACSASLAFRGPSRLSWAPLTLERYRCRWNGTAFPRGTCGIHGAGGDDA